jgi:hypothetical protein
MPNSCVVGDEDLRTPPSVAKTIDTAIPGAPITRLTCDVAPVAPSPQPRAFERCACGTRDAPTGVERQLGEKREY